MKYKYLIFDADQTIFDFNQAAFSALRVIFKNLNIDFSKRNIDFYLKANQKSWDDLESGRIEISRVKELAFSQFFSTLGLKGNPKEVSDFFLNQIGKSNLLIPGAYELVKKLHYENYFLILGTNGLAVTIRGRLKITGIQKYFHHVCIAEEIGCSKPNMNYYSILNKNFPFGKSKTLMIGDNLNSDIAGGNAYGIDTCWFNPNHRPNESPFTPTFVINELYELNLFLK